ncbi:MAG: tyrosine-type recombinase/integrase [Ignavibacteria bacterium]
MSQNVRVHGKKFQGRVTVNGVSVTKSFTLKSDAEKWCRHQKVAMEKGDYKRSPSSITLTDAISKYEREVLPLKRARVSVAYLLAYWKQSGLRDRLLTDLTPLQVATERDRLATGGRATATVRRYLDALSSVLTSCVRDWHLIEENPALKIRKPENGRPRDRRIAPGELDAILEAAAYAPDLKTIIMLAIESGMRRSEILGLAWSRIDLGARVIFLPLTKNGESRTVPLTCRARDELASLPRREDGAVFSKNPTSLSGAFQRAVQRARKKYETEQKAAGTSERQLQDDPWLRGIRFHDLRHERISSLVEGGFNLIEVAMVSGHKTMQCLKRYSHLQAGHLIAKLDRLPSARS